MSEFTTTGTTENFSQEVLDSSKPVLVDFWASWCQPCLRVAPIIEALAKEHSGDVKVVKVDVDANPEVASKYRISSIPTMMLFKEGDVVDVMIGAGSKAQIEELITR